MAGVVVLLWLAALAAELFLPLVQWLILEGWI